ncbi:putative RNA polymerase ECF-type sigma factor [Sphingomonas parapaucimobilis NBRC 15100]|uniref:Putative RNA polymerase ECF-type sigma factor n=1 Tax=Sphingomonas parapaucimobilis NBRC 15100 TaxID=1219049 RepID=A0A0A1W5E3_9SPHN|nr:putative RNA polymerase ECF-type sigma factor [Sphingomonas parapaucimobilis NBRC 15100]
MAYLWRIATSVGLDQAKRDLRRASDMHVPLDGVELVAPDVERQLEARDELRRIERAVQAMRPRTRAIFLAHRVDGMSYAEIAQACGIGVKGVEKQMSRAIAILAHELDQADNG